MKKSAIVVCLAALFFSATGHAVVEIEDRLAELEQYLEKKLERQLTQLFPGTPMVATLKIKVARALGDKGDGAGAARKDFVDLGYIPFPVDTTESAAATAATQAAGRRIFRIESTNVSIVADPRVEDDTLELVKESVNTILDGYAPKVEVKKIGKDGSALFARARSSDYAERSPAAEEKESRAWIAVAGFFSSLILALAVVFVGFYLRRAAALIAEGLRSSKGGGASKDGSASGESSLDGTFSLGGNNTSLGIKLPIDMTIAYERNLAALRRSLDEKPEMIAQELQAAPDDADGVRWLLPQLEPKQQESLRQWLGPSKTNQLLALAGGAAPEAGVDPVESRLRWLQHFVERVALRRVRGGSPVDAALGAELAMQVSSIAVLDVEKWVLETSTAAAWRVAAEFVPAERFSRLLEKIDDDKWKLLADAADANPKELVASAKQLVESKREKDPEAAKRTERRNDYFQRLLTEPLVVALKRRPLATQDELLATFQSEHPDLVKSLEARFWSVKQLSRVPEPMLRQTFEGTSTDEKIALLTCLPELMANRFRKWLPEGNVKIIVEDRVKKITTKQDPRELANAAEIAQRFVDGLRGLAQSGQFDLLPDDASQEESAPVPLRRAS